MAEDSGSVLVRAGLISKDLLARLRDSAARRDGTLVEYLILRGHAPDEEVTTALARELVLRRVDPNHLARIPASLIEAVPGELCAEHRLVPVALDEHRNLTLAMSDPADVGAVDEVAFFTDTRVVRAVATQLQIAWCLAHYYGVITPLGETLLTPQDEPGSVPPGASQGRPGPADIAPPDEPSAELSPRAGEVESRSEEEATPADSREALPRVVLDDSLRATAPGGEEVLLLERRRPAKETVIGAPGAPANAPARRSSQAREDDVTTEPGRIPVAAAVDLEGEPPSFVDDAPEDGVDGVDDDDRGAHVTDVDRPARISAGDPDVDPPTGRVERFGDRPRAAARSMEDEVDDGWGPPGTTIPPPFLGALPETYDDLDSGAIPIRTDEADTESVSEIGAADVHVELARSSGAIIETVLRLEDASSRDQVIAVLLDHLERAWERAAFLAVKGRALVPWQGRRFEAAGHGELPVEESTALGGVVRANRPFRGAVTDSADREYLARILGTVPDEVLALPVSVRQRVVGVLYADTPLRRVFDEHLAVITHGAGTALARILKAHKGRH